MVAIIQIMLDVIAPIFLVMGVAYAISRRFKPEPRPLSVFLIYLFTPALVFRGIYTTELTGGEIGRIAVVVVGVAFAMTLVGTLVARWLRPEKNKPDPRREGALLLSIVLVNAANYGIPLNTFAFGEAGGTAAIVYYVISALIGNVLGVFYASRGSASVRDAILNVFKVPIAYAAILGLLFNIYEVPIPLIVERGIIDIAADGSIPAMLALLGLQLARTQFKGQLRSIMIAVGLRLIIGPLVAVPLALLVALEGITFSVAVIQSSMPTAVLASALATQFESDAEYVSAVTLASTVLSVITLSVLIFLLGGPL